MHNECVGISNPNNYSLATAQISSQVERIMCHDCRLTVPTAADGLSEQCECLGSWCPHTQHVTHGKDASEWLG